MGNLVSLVRSPFPRGADLESLPAYEGRHRSYVEPPPWYLRLWFRLARLIGQG